jgi:hypothetical protein
MIETVSKVLKSIASFFWDLLVGETPGLSAGVATLVIGLVALHEGGISAPYLIPPLVVVITLFFSLRHELKKASS